MQHDPDELDLQLLGVLQDAPRISWAAAGAILGASASALAARWARLTASGTAWISVYPNPLRLGMVVAFVTVRCEPGQLASVIDSVRRDPRVVSVDECAGASELLLVVMVRSMPHLSTLLLDDLSARDGVTGISTRIITGVHTEGSRWRLDTLDIQRRRQAMTAGAVPRRSLAGPIEDQWAMIEALTREPRIPIATLARATDLTASTASRHLADLLGSGALAIRLDTAPGVGGWGVTCSWMGQLPLGERARAIDRLCRQPQVRLCMSTTGPSNLTWTIFARSNEGIAKFEEIMGSLIPALTPTESLVHLRIRKKMGWLTDASGHATGEVVVPTVLQPVADQG